MWRGGTCTYAVELGDERFWLESLSRNPLSWISWARFSCLEYHVCGFCSSVLLVFSILMNASPESLMENEFRYRLFISMKHQLKGKSLRKLWKKMAWSQSIHPLFSFIFWIGYTFNKDLLCVWHCSVLKSKPRTLIWFLLLTIRLSHGKTELYTYNNYFKMC